MNARKSILLGILTVVVMSLPSVTHAVVTVFDDGSQGRIVTCKATPTSDRHPCTLADLTPQCRDNKICTSVEDRAVVDEIAGCAAGGSTYNCTPEQRQQVDRAQSLGGEAGCSITNVTCIWRSLMATIGRMALSFGGYALWATGGVFDLLIQFVIVDFKGTLENLGKPDDINAWSSIKVGWTVFRDFANILIIGMFVFIAISLILGLKEYGQKKLIANVLVVAVLLNFSLLFTTIVIDGSNFVAQQFYNGMTVPTAAGKKYDIAQQFLKPMGITTIWNDAGQVTRKIADDNKSGWAALAFGLVGGLMLFIVALVLLYGCYLIAARGVLFIVLMLVSAVAFATYLIPSLSGGEYGFKAWLKTLLNAAIFAPLLMLSLAISLAIVTIAGDKTTGALGSITSNPASLSSGLTSSSAGSPWQALLVYALGTGLLFVSFRLSNKFAGHISGFNLSGLATLLPFTLGAKFLAAPAARQTAGRAALSRSESLQGQARNATLEATFQNSKAGQYRSALENARKRGDKGAAELAEKNLKAAQSLADRSASQAAKFARQSAAEREKANRTYDVSDAIKKAVGAGGTEKTTSKSYLQEVEEKARQAAKLTEIARPGAAETDAMRERAKEEATREHEAEMRKIQASHQDAIAAQRVAEEQLQVQRDALRTQNAGIIQQQELAERSVASAQAAKVVQQKAFDRRSGELARELREATNDADKTRLRAELQDLQQTHPAYMRGADDVITEKEQDLAAVKASYARAVEEPLAPLTAAAKAARDAAESADRAVNSLAQNRAGDIRARSESYLNNYRDAANKATLDVATHIGMKIGDPKVAEATRAAMRKQQGTTARMKKFLDDVDMGSQTPKNTQTPPAGGTPTT